jgi:hypothetical protein
MDEFLKNLPANITVSAVMTGFVVWLTKSWISERLKDSIQHEYNQLLESHKAQLAAANQGTLERLRADLTIASKSHEIKFSTLHEKRAACGGLIYSSLLKTIIRIKAALSNQPEVTESELKRIFQPAEDLGEVLFPNYVFIPKELAESVEQIGMEFYRAVESVATSKDKSTAREKAIEELTKLQFKVKDMADDFRKLFEPTA